MRLSGLFYLSLLVFVCLLSFLSCGEGEAEEEGESDALIVIEEGDVFATTEITAPSEGVITILNRDDTAHTITATAEEGNFEASEDFDVTVAADSSALLTLPTAPAGTVFFFYCRFHEDSMSPDGGTITIE